ncbi:dTDP-4-dehydrorhamnose reductase [Candidatus Nitrospira bockiana]
MRVFLTGANGQLGHELQHVLAGHELVLGVRPAFDLLTADVEALIATSEPEVVIHAAAYTHVDKAEQEPDLAMAVNAAGTERVARAAQKVGARMIYVSTDYVFDGGKDAPYLESDDPHPLNWYGRSKLEGERRAQALCARTVIVRTSWVYGAHGANFVKTIIRLSKEQPALRVVADQRGTPTHAGDLAVAIGRILERPDLSGITHATGAGDCTWYDFAVAIVSEIGAPVPVLPITTQEANRPAPRPAYSVLANRVLMQAGIVLPDWKDALSRYVRDTRSAQSH